MILFCVSNPVAGKPLRLDAQGFSAQRILSRVGNGRDTRIELRMYGEISLSEIIESVVKLSRTCYKKERIESKLL